MTPETRLEAYLNAISTAMEGGGSVSIPSTPQTREEKYLDAIVKKLGGEEGEKPSTPLTRIESYLDEIEANAGGGGGSDLADKTITANGTYSPADDGVDGYSSVTVNVELDDARGHSF